MKIRFAATALLGFLASMNLPASCQAADEPAGKATPAQPALKIDDSTPEALLRVPDEALAAAGLQASIEMSHVTDESQREMAEVMGKHHFALAKLVTAARRKWDKETGDAISHVFGERTAEEMDEAKIEIDGQRAKVRFPGSDQALPLIRVDGHWKLDLAEAQRTVPKDTLAKMVRWSRHVATLSEELERDLAAGKFDSPISLRVAALERSMKRWKIDDPAAN